MNVNVNGKNGMSKKHKLDDVDEITFENAFVPSKKRQRLLLSLSNNKSDRSIDSDCHLNNVNSVNSTDSINLFNNYINAVNDQNKNDTLTKQSVFVFHYAPVQVSFIIPVFFVCLKSHFLKLKTFIAERHLYSLTQVEFSRQHNFKNGYLLKLFSCGVVIYCY